MSYKLPLLQEEHCPLGHKNTWKGTADTTQTTANKGT
jgi:hypothetical protein